MQSARSTCTCAQLLPLLALAAMTLEIVAAGTDAGPAPVAASGYLDTATDCIPAWALPVPYWIFGFLLGPLICMAIALLSYVVLTASPLTKRPEASVFAALPSVKQKKWQICVTKAVVFTAMLASFTPLAANVFADWTAGPDWLLTSYWLTYYRIVGALTTSVYCFELIFAQAFEWDTWLHHACTIIIYCVSLTQTFIQPNDRPYVVAWVILMGWTSSLDIPVYICMSYYHIATPDQAALRRKYWATLTMCANKCVSIPAMNILPLSWIFYNWNNLAWSGTKAILLVTHVPFLLTQILAAMAFYKIMKLNQRRYRCSLAKPVGRDNDAMDEGKDALKAAALTVGAMEEGMPNESFNTRYEHQQQRTTTGRSSAYIGDQSTAMVKLSVGEQPQAGAPGVTVPLPLAVPAAQANQEDDAPAAAAARQLNRLRTFATRTMQVTRVPEPEGASSAMARQGSLAHSLARLKSERYSPQPQDVAPAAGRLLRSGTLAAAMLSSFKAAVRDHTDRALDDEEQATDEDVVKLLNTDVVRLLLATCVSLAQSSPAATAQQLAEVEQLVVLSGMNK